MNKKKSISGRLFSALAVQPIEDDAGLMAKVGQGDRQAFAALYEKYKSPILSYLTALVRHPRIAEELAQEVFLRVFRARQTYSVQAKFSTWLWTIARNLAIDHLRRKQELLLVDRIEEGESVVPEPSVEPEAEVKLMERAEKERLEHCLGELTQSQRDAVTLRAFADQSYEEIGQTLSLSQPSVKSLLYRAKATLLECLQGGGGHE